MLQIHQVCPNCRPTPLQKLIQSYLHHFDTKVNLVSTVNDTLIRSLQISTEATLVFFDSMMITSALPDLFSREHNHFFPLPISRRLLAGFESSCIN